MLFVLVIPKWRFPILSSLCVCVCVCVCVCICVLLSDVSSVTFSYYIINLKAEINNILFIIIIIIIIINLLW